MSQADPRFADFIARCVASLGLPAPNVTENRYMFKIGDRWVELKYEPGDDRVTLAALVFMQTPDEPIHADLLASFNVYHLFSGGYALVNPDNDGVVYLCQAHRLAALRTHDIRRLLEEFALRASAAGTWYLARSGGGPEPAAAPLAGGDPNSDFSIRL